MRACVVVALAGCFNPSLAPHLPCAQPDHWCPPPQSCGNDGFCEGGEPADAGDDAGIPASNIVFVTSEAFTPDEFGPDNAAIESAADAKCNMLGQKLRAGGTYMAWLGVSQSDAASRVAARITADAGWARPDGRAVVLSLGDLLAGNIYDPPRIDDDIKDAVALRAMTNVVTELPLPPNSCFGGGNQYRFGLPAGEEPSWRSFDVRTCHVPGYLYCFETDRSERVAAPVLDTSLLLAFVTPGTYALSAGIDALDGDCQGVADGAGLAPRKFKAFVAPNGMTPRARFIPSPRAWTRLDGVVVAQPELKELDAPLSVAPPSAHLKVFAAFGAVDATTDAQSNCSNWTATMGDASTGDSTLSDLFGLFRGTAPCNGVANLYCLETP